MGKKKNREMLFWTKEEYLKFADAMMDKPMSYYAFEMLYWTGIREGELLALTTSARELRFGIIEYARQPSFILHLKMITPAYSAGSIKCSALMERTTCILQQKAKP